VFDSATSSASTPSNISTAAVDDDDVDADEVAESFGTVSHAAKNKANNTITKYLV
jgi:hypothetical protein